jgi:hypothetical protein
MTVCSLNASSTSICRRNVESVALACLFTDDCANDCTEVFALVSGGYLKISRSPEGKPYIYSSIEGIAEWVEPEDLLSRDLEVDRDFGIGTNSGLIVTQIVVVNSNRRLTLAERVATQLPTIPEHHGFESWIGENR